MNDHLSEDEFARCVLDLSAERALRHIGECSGCRQQLDRFRATAVLFRSAVRDHIDTQTAVNSPILFEPAGPARSAAKVRWSWAIAVAVIVVIALIPLFRSEKKAPKSAEVEASVESDPGALMRDVQFHLSHTVPDPMAPMFLLLPDNGSKSDSGGIQ